MLGNITVAENIYIACGYTDMRKSIDGLAAVVQQQFRLDPFSKTLFLFCGKRRDRIKVLLRKEKFGPSSEKTPKQVEGQLSLFNEAEVEADASIPEPISKEVKGYVRKNPRTKREEIIKDLPVREILCETDESEQHCDHCNSKLKALGKEVVREELEYIPTKLQIVRYVRMAYECHATNTWNILSSKKR